MIKKIIALPDERIRQKSDEVVAFNKALSDLIENLVETSEIQTDPPALGMAAPQIGVFKRVFVAKIQKKFRAFVNARIIKSSKKEAPLLEGCFSVQGIYGHVTRPVEVAVQSQDKSGKSITKTYKGLAAKIIQHEIDHLEGILFTDHIHEQNAKLFRIEKDKNGKEELVEITAV